VFLLVNCRQIKDGDEKQKMAYWEIGVGNADSLVETTAERLDGSSIESEDELVKKLLRELDQYRYDDTVILTPDDSTLRELRHRLVVPSIASDTPSLRGYSHVTVQKLLREYFDQTLSDYEIDRASRSPPRQKEDGSGEVVTNGAAQNLWETWVRIFNVVPASALLGDLL
jgi:hypothetical protein